MIESGLFWSMLAGALIVHALLPLRWRFWFLVATSIAYLCIASPNNVKMHSYAHALILMSFALATYYLAPLTADPRALIAQGSSATLRPLWLRRLIFWGLIVLILGYLAFLKYLMPTQWWRGAILKYYALPLGVSYFSFKLIDMLIYSARNPLKPKALDEFLCSVFIFPTAAAGPIERYEHFQQNSPNVTRSDDLLQGSTRIIYGLIKRFVIVECLFSDQWRYVTRGSMWEHLHTTNPLRLWWAAFSVFLYLYLDFSAYSDIAIGCCRLFGIRLMENFNWPVFAPNIASFWKRWHMTLTGWCTSYVYMPIVGATRWMNLATFATFVAIGLWHGTYKSNVPWLLWGIYNGLGMIGYQYWVRIKRFYKWAWCNHWLWYGTGIALTLMFVCVGDLLALAEPRNFAQAGRVLMRMAFISVHA